MKARPFLAVVLAVTLLAAGLAAAGWGLVRARSPLRLQHQPLTVPRAARFVPRQAPLSLFLLSDGSEPVGYARAVAPPRQRREAAEAIERLRDGAFAAAGLDYPSELAAWLAPEVALAVLDAPAPGAGLADSGWLLALRSRDDEGARRFLQRFWQTRSLAGTDLQVSRYRGMGLISGRGALVGRAAMPIATALVDDDLVLIASGRGVLEQALDVSQLDELNLAAHPPFGEGLDRLRQGAALLVARPAALERWLDLPRAADPEARPSLLLAALRPQGPGLRLEALLDLPGLPAAASGPADPAPSFRALLEGGLGRPDSLTLSQDPASWLQLPLLRPLLERALLPGDEAGPLPALVAEADAGPLLVSDGPRGWLLATSPRQPSPAAIEAGLAARGLIAAPLQVRERELTVWTRLEASRAGQGDPDGPERLQASLAGWRSEEGELTWWGGSRLDLLQAGEGRSARARRRQLEALGAAQAPLQWALAADPARALLRPWQPWRLLSTLAGGGLDGAVEGISLALEPEGPQLRIRARLELAGS